MEKDLAYYRRRSREEAAAAADAYDPRVKQVHLDLAERYAERAAILESPGSHQHLRLVSAA